MMKLLPFSLRIFCGNIIYKGYFDVIALFLYRKYFFGGVGENMARLDEQDFDEKRLARRQKRQRSQLIAYILLSLVLILIVAGVVFGVHALRGALKKDEVLQTPVASDDGSYEESTGFTIATPKEETQEVAEMTESDVLTEIVDGIISEMTLEDKVAGLFMVTPEQITGVATVVKAGSGTQDALAKYAVGGIVYSAKNLKTSEQTAEMLKATSDMSKYPLFTAVTEDTGDGSAISSTIGGIDIVDINSSDAGYSTGNSIAAAMFKYGFNFDFAPDLDITENGRFGTDVEQVNDITGAFVQGLEESGITACVHDFPVSADTTETAVVDESTREMLVTGAYEVYKNAFENGGAKAVMLTNASLPQLTGDNTPASLSEKIIQEELRGALNFDGVVLTGPLHEGAITESYPSDQVAVEALKAGADIIYLPEDFEAAYNGILSALESGELSENRINESLTRIYRIKYAEKAEQLSGN